MMIKNKKILYATVVFVIVISLQTVGYLWASGAWNFDATGRIKTKADLSFDTSLDFGAVESPSETIVTKEIINVGESSTQNLAFTIFPTEGLDGISVVWDYDGSPIASGDTVTIGFTLIVTDEASAGTFSFTLQIYEV